MKKIRFLFLAFMILFTSCSTDQPLTIKPEKLPVDYTYKTALKNGDVMTDLALKPYNMDKFSRFLVNTIKGKKDKIRITYFTIEGYAIINEIYSHDGKITIICDTSRNRFGQMDIQEYHDVKLVKRVGDGVVEVDFSDQEGHGFFLLGLSNPFFHPAK